MTFLLIILFPFYSISAVFKSQSFFKNKIEGRNRNPAFPDQGRFTDKDAIAIFKSSKRLARQLEKTIPKQKTSGGTTMVRSAAVGIARYRAMRDYGIEKEYALELVGDVGYQFYKIKMSLLRRVARICTRDRAKQMDIIQRLAIKVGLQSPDYEIVIRNPPSSSEYDVRRCPVYEYCKTVGEEELAYARKIVCYLDWAIAEFCVEGGFHRRTKALSWGDEMCDMKWLVK